MLGGDNLTWLRLEFSTDLATPLAVFETLAPPRCPLNGRDVLPSLVVFRSVSVMHCIEDRKLRVARGIQDLQHVGNAVVRFCNAPNTVPDFPSFGNEVVIRVDHHECGELLTVCRFCHSLAPMIMCRRGPHYVRSGLRPARTSSTKSCGCSQAA